MAAVAWRWPGWDNRPSLARSVWPVRPSQVAPLSSLVGPCWHQPPLYKLKTKKEEIYVTDDGELRELLIERGLGSVVVNDKTSNTKFEGAELTQLCKDLGRLEDLVRRMIPAWTRIDAREILSSWDGGEVPSYWAAAPASSADQAHFFATKDELDNWLELQRAGLGYNLHVSSQGSVAGRDYRPSR